MRHSVFGRKLSRTKNERRRLFAGLIRDLLIRNQIVTTVAKAKAVQPLVEKLITKAKSGTETDRRRVDAVLTDRKITSQLFEYAKTRFASRSSGFTRVIKLGIRKGDSTNTAVLSFVDEKVVVEQIAVKKEVKQEVKKLIKATTKIEKKEDKKKLIVEKTKSKKIDKKV
jgi:large subunit ribosomal protein L17